MKSGFPQQKRRSPCNVRVELVVQAARTQHADSHGSQQDSHCEIRGYAQGHCVLVAGLSLGHDDFEELAERAFGGLDPAGEEEGG